MTNFDKATYSREFVYRPTQHYDFLVQADILVCAKRLKIYANKIEPNKSKAWFRGLVRMGVDHWGNGEVPSPEFGAGDCPSQILSCCKILSTRLLALQCRKMFFCVYSIKTCIVSPAMRPPRIPVRSTPMLVRHLAKKRSDLQWRH